MSAASVREPSRNAGAGLAALADWSRRHRRLVVAAWLVCMLGALPFAARQSEHLQGGGDHAAGSASHVVAEEGRARFPAQAGGPVAVLVRPRPGSSRAARRAALRRATAGLRRHVGVAPGARSVRRAERELARGRAALIGVVVDRDTADLVGPASDLRAELRTGEPVAGVQSYVVGQAAMWAGVRDRASEELRSAESLGLPVVALVLLAVFGSLAAAALPFVLGVSAVLLTGAVIFFVSQQFAMSVYVSNVASMIGIGVAVDYSLFVLVRYRSELAAGVAPDAALRRALATSGLAIAVSGGAVAVSLAAVFVADAATLRSMAFGAIVVVSFAVLLTIVLLPALIALFGRRLATRARWARRSRRGSAGGGGWERWSRLVTRRPALSVAAVAAVMIALAVPALSIDTGAGPVTQLSPDDEIRQGYELAGAHAGGYPSVRVLLRARGAASLSAGPGRAALRRTLALARREPEVARASVSARGPRAALVDVVTRRHPEAVPTRELARQLRDRLGDDATIRRAAAVLVGGESARVEDITSEIQGSIPPIVAVLLASAFVILAFALRSLLLPLKAVAMNLLSVAAAWGVMVAVFQWGWLGGLFGFHEPGHLTAIAPVFVLVVAFGLSMDYELFLLSRIRERYAIHGDNRRAVHEGLASSAGPISSAALIMCCVLFAFVITGVASVKEIGLGAAVAIALDATLVRLILVPASMELFGRWNWWLPGWLARRAPAFFEAPPVAPGEQPSRAA